MAEVVHIAGMPAVVGPKYRQLCAWCGFALIDGDTANEAVATSELYVDPRVRFWEQAVLVAVDGPGSWVVANGPDEPLPLRCCASQQNLTLVPKEDANG